MASGMTKTQLIRHLAGKTNLSNKTASRGIPGAPCRHCDQGDKEEWRVCGTRSGPFGEGAPQGSRGT